MRRSWAPLAVVVVPVVFFVGICLFAWRTGSAEPSGTALIGSASVDPAYPIDTLRDLVSYSDQVSVVRVVDEELIPEGSEAESGGLENRTVTVRVEDTIWRGPSGLSAPDSLDFTDWGRMKGRTLGEEGGARLEVGRRYLIALARGTEEGRTAWWSYTAGAQLQLRNGVLDPDDVLGEPSRIFTALAGLTVGEAAKVIAATEPDPLAVKYARLGGRKRWEAVARERS
jgi:hypothetical protein